MKSICAAFLVLAAVACNKSEPVDTTSTTSAEALPVADTNGTTPPPAVPEVGTGSAANHKRLMSAKPTSMSTANDGVTTTSTVPSVDDREVAPAQTAVVPTVQGTTSTTTTTTITTVKKKPVAKPGGDYGTGAARGDGINSNGEGNGVR